MLTTRQASDVIGVSIAQVRWLIRHGQLKATRHRSMHGGPYYLVDPSDAKRLGGRKKLGRPRGGGHGNGKPGSKKAGKSGG